MIKCRQTQNRSSPGKTPAAQIEMSLSHHQSGLAIITVLMIVALMVTLLGFLIEQQHLLIRRIANQNVSEQGHQLATGVDAWAARVLHDDVDRNIDYWGEDWARFGDPPEVVSAESSDSFSLDLSSQQEKEALPEIDFGIDGLEYQIIDLNGRYNLNNLANPDANYLKGQKTIFLNLLSVLEVGDFDTRQGLYAALVDWMDPGDLVTPGGGVESGDYQIKPIPYYAADQKLAMLGELRFIEGYDEAVINSISPYVTVLPVDNAGININTTSSEVLASLSTVPVVDLSSVETFLALRLEKGFLGFQSSEILSAQTAIIGTTPLDGGFIPNMLQTNSQFYKITSRVTLGDYVYCTQTTMLRESANAAAAITPKVTILSRQHDTLCNEIVR